MTTILAIATDSRALKLIKACQQCFKVRLEVASDFDHGLKTIFEARPRLIFVQNEISGILANVVARHVKGLLRNEAPLIIVLSSGPCPPGSLENSFDAAVDLTLDDISVGNALLDHMQSVCTAKVTEPQEDEESNPFPELEPTTLSTPQDELNLPGHGFFFLPPEPPEEEPADKVSTIIPVPEPPSIVPTEESKPERPKKTVIPESDKLDKDLPEGFIILGPETETPQRKRTRESETNWHSTPPKPKDDQRKKLMILAILVAFACIEVWWLSGNNPPPQPPQKVAPRPAPPVQQPAPQPQQPEKPAQPQALVLPAIMAKAALDPEFTASHPGWERRVSPGVEFRIFREASAIKAIQTLATSKEPLAANFLQTIVAEACGTGNVAVSRTTERNGYLIEQGMASANSEIELYRLRKSGALRGFVITMLPAH